jgi:hypothetical protein
MNGFVNRQLALKGMPANTHQFKQCNKCEQDKPPEGGIQMSLNKWHCASCWVIRTIKRPKNS